MLGFSQFIQMPRPAMMPGQRAAPATTGVRPDSGSIDLDQAINSSNKREKTWSLSPAMADWNDVWPSMPGQPPLLNDTKI